MGLADARLSAVVCGLTLHFLFNRFEEQHITALKRLLLVSPLLSSYALWSSSSSYSLIAATFLAYTITYNTLIASLILYRISPIHPLASYPGPLLAKCTKFWGVYHCATGKTHINFLNLHRRYGPIVRTGPNELSFCDVDVIQPVLGTHGMDKGPIWDGRRAPKSRYHSLLGIRETNKHLLRRKLWNKALNVSAVRNYEPILLNRLKQLVGILRVKSDQRTGVDIAELMSFFAYDFMGDMAFGGGFELMKDGDTEGLWKLMEGGLRVQAYTQHIPWAISILSGVPGIGEAAAKLLTFVTITSMKRINRGPAPTGEDLSSHLLDEGSSSPNPLSFGDYRADAFLAIIAGSDTAATVLSCIIFYLISDKSLFTRLRKEIDANFSFADNQSPMDDTSKLANLPFLNAVINEALRLNPPVPTGLQRAPHPGTNGRMIGTRFIPEGTAVNIPPYVIHRDPRYFSPDPDRFWPDRWLSTTTTESSSIPVPIETNQSAFIPYSIGPMNCAGKLLAQLELRVVITTLVQQFDMDFQKDYDTAEWESSFEDYFVFKKGVLPIIVRKRAIL